MKLSKKERYEFIGMRRNVIKSNKQFVINKIRAEKARVETLRIEDTNI